MFSVSLKVVGTERPCTNDLRTINIIDFSLLFNNCRLLVLNRHLVRILSLAFHVNGVRTEPWTLL